MKSACEHLVKNLSQKAYSAAAGCKGDGRRPRSKKSSTYLQVRLRAFSSCVLAHRLFARARYEEPFEIDSKRLRPGAESGVAMVTVIIMSAVLLLMGTGMYYVASSEQSMSQGNNVGGQAFYFAEGGLENVLDILNYEATEWQLTQPRNGQYLMNPDASQRQDNPDPVTVTVGNQTYKVWVDEVDQYGSHCTGCGLVPTSKNPAYLMVYAEGQTSEGYRKLQQQVKLTPTGYPLDFFINGNVTINGNEALTNQSLFVNGYVAGRKFLTVSGTDSTYGMPAGVFATGRIYANSNKTGPIYTTSGAEDSKYWNSDYINDRDQYGPTGNPFSTSALQGYFNYGGGLTTSQLATLQNEAQTSGYYNGNASGSLTIQQSDLPDRSGDIVIYVDFPSGNPQKNVADLKFSWPPDPSYTGKALIVVLNGSINMEGGAIGQTTAVIYCPDGSVTAHGSGNQVFNGYVWGDGFTDEANFTFNLSPEMINDPPFFSWTVTRGTWQQDDQ